MKKYVINYHEDLSLDIISALYEKNKDKQVLIVDLVHGKRLVPTAFDACDQTIYDIYDYFNEDVSLYKAMIEVDDGPFIIASSYYEDKLSKTLDFNNFNKDINEEEIELLIVLDYKREFSEFDGQKIEIIEKEEDLNLIKEGAIIIIDKSKDLLKNKQTLERIDALIEKNSRVIGVFDGKNQLNMESLIDNIYSDISIDYKNKSIFERIKEVFTS